jgi:Zn-dependent peptidase ImmA (M78 family)
VSVRVDIAPGMLDWAVERSGRPRSELATKFPKLEEWAKGEVRPTLKQLEGFARATYTPVGTLFLREPPAEPLPVPDFRTRGRREAMARPSANLLDTIYICEARQEWYREYARRNDLGEIDFVGSVQTSDSTVEVAAQIRSRLDFGLDARRQFSSWSEALRELIHRAEDLGVLVMVNGVVEHNTHRALDPDEFGGFTLVDPVAPLVFINGADTKAAQIFTLAHELAHVWLGQSAVSDRAFEIQDIDVGAEEWCNKVAAELLVPRESIEERFVAAAELHDELGRLARFYRVSTLVVLRRLLDVDLIDWQIYIDAYAEQLDRLKDRRDRTGGDFYATTWVRSSPRFTTALVSETLSGRTLYRDAFRLLGIKKIETFTKLGERLGLT